MYNDKAVVSGLIAILGGAIIFFALIAIAVIAFQIVAIYKVYKKAGKDGWEAIVPYYNTWVLCEIAEVKWWFFLIILSTTICGILGLIVLEPLAILASLGGSFAVHYNVAKKFGKDPIGYGIGLTLLPVVFYAILAFGDAKYTNVKVSSYGPIEEEKFENQTSSNTKQTHNKATNKSKFCKNCGAELDSGKFCPNCGSEIH